MINFKEETIDIIVPKSKRPVNTKLSVCLDEKIPPVMNKASLIEYAVTDDEKIEYTNQLLRAINDLYKDVKKTLIHSLPAERKAEITFVKACLQEEGSSVIISFDALPGKRNRKVYDKTHEHITAFCDAFYNAVSSYYKGKEFEKYKSKVLIRYHFFFDSYRNMCDFDNYDLKVLTDAITAFFLKDDSPLYVTQMLEGEIDESATSHLTITISPI